MENSLIHLDFFIKKLGKDTFTYAPAKLLPGIINIVSVAVFTRLFSPNDYGQYILVITTTTIFSAIFSQWLTQSTLRYRANYIVRAKELTFNKNFLLILLFLSVFVLLLTVVGYPFSKILGDYQRFFLISIFIIISQIWFDNLITIYQADLKAFKFSLYTILNAIFKFAFTLILIFLLAEDIIILLSGVLFSYLCLLIPMVITLQKISHSNQASEKFTNSCTVYESFIKFSKHFFNYGFPMIGWFLGAQLLGISDRYFIQIFRSSEEVGIYSSNYNLVASAISFVSMPLLTAAHPLLMKAGTAIITKKEEVQNIITIFSRYFLIISIPILVYVTFLSKELADVFLGLEYRQGYLVLPIVLFGLFAWNFAMFGHKGLEFREKTNIMFMYVMICTAIKVILNILFIPKYGYIAAAITTSICFFLYPTLVYFGTKPDIAWIIPWFTLVKTLIATLVSVIPLFVIRTTHNSFFSLVIGLVVMIPIYFAILYYFKEFYSYERKYLRNFLKHHFFL